MRLDRDLTSGRCDRKISAADHIGAEFLVGAPRLQARATRTRELAMLCFNGSRPAFLPSSQGTWFRLENYGRTFRRSHLGQFPMLHRMNIARHRRGDLCIRDGLASTTRRNR
jgi:hypothetical protein